MMPGSFRQALAKHYIGYDLQDWPRLGFDGEQRHYPWVGAS